MQFFSELESCPMEPVLDLYSGLRAENGPSKSQHIFRVLFMELTAIFFNCESEELETA